MCTGRCYAWVHVRVRARARVCVRLKGAVEDTCYVHQTAPVVLPEEAMWHIVCQVTSWQLTKPAWYDWESLHCFGDAHSLPHGWEIATDSVRGVYLINHVTWQTFLPEDAPAHIKPCLAKYQVRRTIT